MLSHGSREARRSKTFSEDLCRHKGRIKGASAQETQVRAKQKQIKRRHSSLVWTRLVQSSLGALAAKGGPLEIRPTISCANWQNKQSTAARRFHSVVHHEQRLLLVPSVRVPFGIDFDQVGPLLIKWLTRHSSASSASSASNPTQPTTALPTEASRAIGETYGSGFLRRSFEPVQLKVS